MLTVTQAFEKMRQDLELTDAQRQTAADQQSRVRESLRLHLGGLDRDFLSGSYSRRTAIRPLHDIDLFIVLSPSAHREVYPGNNPTTSACLSKVQGALARAYPNTQAIKRQDHSVNIELSGTGIGYDIVPAFENAAGVYMIPDRRRDAWIQTNPEAHGKALVAANDRAGGKLNPLIKMAKHWKKHHAVPLRSFHLEVMSYGAFSSAPASYPEGMRALFAHLANTVQTLCPDPAGVGPHIDTGTKPEERTKARTKLLEAESAAARAIQLGGMERTADAHEIWKGLFGQVYQPG